MSFFSFGTFNSNNYKLNLTTRQVYDAPVFDYTSVEVPGRSGDILISQDRFKNKTIVYRGFYKASDFAGGTDWEKMHNAATELKGQLLRNSGDYQTLKDGYDDGLTRWAVVQGITITPIMDRPVGAEVEVTFNARPFMYDEDTSGYLSTGSSPVTSITLTNPYYFEAKPRFTIQPKGANSQIRFTVNGNTWRLWKSSGTFSSSDYIYCNSEAMEWYLSSGVITPAFCNVTNPTDTAGNEIPFPILKSGTNTISLPSTNEVAQMLVYPRWRTL